MFFIPLPIVLIEVLVFSTFVHFYGFWEVFLWYLLPSFVGAVLFSVMGRSLLMSLQMGFAHGQLPADKMLHRGAKLIGSILLIVPLFLSRVLALFLILPLLRHFSIFIFKTFLFKRLVKSPFSFIRFGEGRPNGFGSSGFGGRSQRPSSFENETRAERDVEVVDVTPIEITHTKIEEESPKKEDTPGS